MGSRRPLLLALVACAATLAAAGAEAGSHTNSAAITIADCCTDPSGVTKASLYPSTINVTGESNTLASVAVTLSGFNHTSPDDVDVLMAAPNGQAIVLMSDAGGFNTASNLTISFKAAASNPVPDSGALTTGTFAVHNWGSTPGPLCDTVEPDPDVFPAPAPAGPYVTSLTSLNGQNPNGNWSLYVVDDCAGDSGSITGGWSINITSNPTAVGLRSFDAVPSPRSVLLRWRTASEAKLLGFNVVRFSGGRTVRVNRSLIRAKTHGSGGASYRLVDRAVRPGSQYTYRLQAVALNGTKTWIGTAAVRTA